ncbi:MAG: hypothetical protein PQJ58_01985 [Spirochaetales bacterium]|nr:hypothetical protein [Spirochaetales bacterium]
MDNLDLLSLENLKRTKDGFSGDFEWTVSGSVSHFGHTHYRKNRYQAEILLRAVEEHWYISGMTVLREEREF